MQGKRSFLTALAMSGLLAGFVAAAPAAMAAEPTPAFDASTSTTSIPVSINKSKKLSGFEGLCWNGQYTGGNFGRAGLISADGGIYVSVRGRNLSPDYPYIMALEKDNVIDGAVVGCQWHDVLNALTFSLVTFSDSSGSLSFTGFYSDFGDGSGGTFRVLVFDGYTGRLVLATGFISPRRG